MTRAITEDIEYRKFIGLDRRSDRTLVSPNNQTISQNTVIERGIYKNKPGHLAPLTLVDTAITGVIHRRAAVDVGDDTYFLLHKGTGLYFGKASDASYTQIQDLAAANIVVSDAESEFEVRGKEVGSSGDISLKVLHKTADKITCLEWNGTTWIARNCGIENDMTFTSAVIGSNINLSPLGTYRLRLVAQRIVNGIRVNESAPTSEDGTTPAEMSWQEVVVVSGSEIIELNIAHTSPDPQITHYSIQMTHNLQFAGNSDYTTNGEDPTIYYETTPILAATALAGAVTIVPGAEDLNVVAPNLVQYLPIPGHLISVQTGGILFFSGIGEFKNRVYKSGISGYYYHNEMYDPFEFFPAGEDDGQELTGLGLVQDHLLIIKEGKTAIVANHDINGPIVWRDRKIGALHRRAFDNISEDQVIVYCQDGIFRIFDGIRYDRQQEIEGQQYYFSENIRDDETESIDPATLEFVYHRERLHILFGENENRKALVMHPRDYMAWTEWVGVTHYNNMLVNNGNDWYFGKKDGKLYEQSSDSDDDDDDGAAIDWEIRFAVLSSQVSRKNKILIKLIGIDGDFDNSVYSEVLMDLGRLTTGQQIVFPDPPLNPGLPWYQCYLGRRQVDGNYIELILRGTGKMTLRGIYKSKIEKKSGNLGWRQPITDTPPTDALIIDAGADTDTRTTWDIYDAREDTEDRSAYPNYVRP